MKKGDGPHRSTERTTHIEFGAHLAMPNKDNETWIPNEWTTSSFREKLTKHNSRVLNSWKYAKCSLSKHGNKLGFRFLKLMRGQRTCTTCYLTRESKDLKKALFSISLLLSLFSGKHLSLGPSPLILVFSAFLFKISVYDHHLWAWCFQLCFMERKLKFKSSILNIRWNRLIANKKYCKEDISSPDHE